MKPPRALWVPFELGRPLGAPGDPVFQRRVLMAALELLGADAGPVLVDFPDDAPGAGAAIEGWACPVDLSSPDGELSDDEILRREFLAETMRLRPWYDLGLARRGRSAAGAADMPLDQLFPFIADFLDCVPENPRPDLPLAAVLNLAVADLKAYYTEAVTARPGPAIPDGAAVADWFWRETVAGKFLREIKHRLRYGNDPLLKLVAIAMIVPVSHAK